MSLAKAPSLPTATPVKAAFDDVMLAMDIVDTLRHRELALDRELGAAGRKDALIARLRDIYKAQGIDVPDRILEDGVQALEEKRFVYDPPSAGFGRRLAMIYIRRGRWLKPLAFVLGVALFVTAAYEIGFDNPREARAERERVELTVTLPASLKNAHQTALALATTPAATARIDASYRDGVSAAAAGDADGARAAVGDLEFLTGVLEQELTVRVVSRAGEYSGVFRIPDDAPDARNYYLIVEAVDARGRARELEIASEEDQRTTRAKIWGVRVPEAEFNRIAADKQDDQIIQHADIGRKPKGALTPTYDAPIAGGAILEW
jgi:hypothetical protein